MSNPILIVCTKCKEQFIYIRGSIEECPKCKKEEKEKEENGDLINV